MDLHRAANGATIPAHMKPTQIYGALCLVGAVVPYAALVPFLRQHGLDLRLLAHELFSSPVGAFFGWDVVLSSAALWAFVLIDCRRSGVKHWWAPLLANLVVGVSLGLPLFLYLRERQTARDRFAPVAR
jgi:hypothetical protein